MNLRASPASGGVAFAFTGGGLPDEIKLLAATWAATGRLGEALSASQMATLQRSGAWPETARLQRCKRPSIWTSIHVRPSALPAVRRPGRG